LACPGGRAVFRGKGMKKAAPQEAAPRGARRRDREGGARGG
jgi:hypothetical protein